MWKNTWKEWLLDVSCDPPAFVPYERETDTIVLGMTVISSMCPGKLVGIIHCRGQEEVEKWCQEHPDWISQYNNAA